MLKKMFLVFLVLIPLVAFADPQYSTIPVGQFMPDNNMWISVDDKNASMSEARFHEIIDQVGKVYAPVIEAKGKQLQFEYNWTDGTVNAYAYQEGNVWHVAMFGGLARSPEITDDGFMAVVCHELGHHLGGAPKYKGQGNTWASNEGQSDYWAMLKCMRKVLENEDNETIVANMKIDPIVTQKCDSQYNLPKENALCRRLAMAGYSLAQLLGGGKFSTPDRTVVQRTSDSHPASQCRLDTYFASALCTADLSVDVSDTDATVGTCMSGIGARPACWFKK